MVKHATRHSPATTADDLKHLLAKVEKTLARLPDEANDEIAALRSRLSDVLSEGRVSLERLRDSAREQIERADDFVHDHPYETIGVATAIGVLTGYLIARSLR